MNTTHPTGPDRQGDPAALMQGVDNRPRTGPAVIYGLADVNVSQVTQITSRRWMSRRGLAIAAAIASALGRTCVECAAMTLEDADAALRSSSSVTLLDLVARADSAARGCQQGGHRDIESLGHGSQVVDRPPRPASKPHGQRRLAQAHLSRQGFLTDTSASHPGAHLCGHPQAQLIHCGLCHDSTIGGSLPPGTHPATSSNAPPPDASSHERTGYPLIS